MADNTNKVTIDAEPITIPAAQFSRILAAAVHCEYLMKQKHLNEEKIHRMRMELTRYQTICENCKGTSDAGALAIEAEGRVSGGERAELESLRKERDELKARIDELENNHVPKVEAALRRANMAGMDADKRLAAAERCIRDVSATLCELSVDGDYMAIRALHRKTHDIIRAYRAAKEAK